MNIFYASASVLPSETADSVHVMKMCEALAQCGNSVVLQGIRGEQKDGADVFGYYNVEPIFRLDQRAAGKGHLLDRVRAIVSNARAADCVYTRYAVAAYICAFFLHKKTVYEYHLVMDRFYNKFVEKQLIKSRYVKHAFITRALMQAYQQKYPRLTEDRCIILPDGANDPKIELRRSDKEHLSCGYIGSFAKGKGVETVAKVAALLPEVTFHIVGGKADEIARIKQTCHSDNIIWHGYLKQEEAMRVLRDSIDIALLPNQKKMLVGNGMRRGLVDIGQFTSPMKLFEYMAYGKAIVASRIPVLEEVVHDGENAVLVDPDDEKAWAEAITCLIRDREKYESVRKNAYVDFARNYTWLGRAKKAVSFIG